MQDWRKLMLVSVRLLAAACLLVVFTVAASAYTIVMRGGRRVQIPAQFSVTKTTLTYQVTPDIQVTLQMAAIDVPATEAANGEPTGSLVRRALSPPVPQTPTAETAAALRKQPAQRSVTNRDLESHARIRLESEQKYEQRLKDQGLPPLAVLRAQAAADADRFWQELERKRAEAEANERAAQLQAQLAALSAQLNSLQLQSNQLSAVAPAAFTVFDGFPGFGSFGRSRVNPALFGVPFGVPIGGGFGTFHVPFFNSHFPGFRRSVFVAPGTHIRGRVHFGGRPHGRPGHR
ncbi:MAG: hypothetical protein ACREBG_27080 [Pyrinomonadaceae bacterium]